MANKLVIVESPAKAKTIGKYLGRGYKVEASQGHVRDLPKSQLGIDVENGFEPKYITIRGRGDILAQIRKDAKSATKVFLATDPDREGEAISWHLAHVLNIDPSTACRIEFNEITQNAIKTAIKNPRPLKMDLVDAQQARRVLDRLVGYKISPLLWQKIKKGLSAGRVQSVAAKMICDREEEIETFIPEEYWTITVPFRLKGQTVKAAFALLNGEKRELTNEGEAREIEALCAGRDFVVSAIKSGEKKRNPAPPFTTSNLQQEASRKLNFTTQKTMQIAQQLYEGVELPGEGSVGLVSYIRTDSTRISDEALAAVRDHILAAYGNAYLPEKPNVYKTRASAQDAHEAIRPTSCARTPESVKTVISRDQYKLYKLIYERFVASQMTPALYETLNVELTNEAGVQLRFSGQKQAFDGFTAVYEEGRDDGAEEVSSRNLPDLQEGMVLSPEQVLSEQRFTTPPPRYTEASLVRALEEKGIGRPSTFSPTISTIINRGYVLREKKRLMPTELGKIVNDMMCANFPDIVDITFTAGMEEKLDDVENGALRWNDVIEEFYAPFAETLKHAEASVEKVQIKDEVSDVPCENCGAMLVYKMGRFGKFLACPNFPNCHFTMNIPKTINVPCPKCGAELLERVSRKGRKFYGCERYPECDFVSWDLPVREKCPVCGSNMVFKRGSKEKNYHLCTNESCRHRIQLENGGADDE